MTRWTDSDALNGREALVVGGPSDGLRILVSDRAGQLRYPDAFDASDYAFDRERWEFLYRATAVELPQRGFRTDGVGW